MGSGRLLAMLALDGVGAIDLAILIGFFVFFTAAGAVESRGAYERRSRRRVREAEPARAAPMAQPVQPPVEAGPSAAPAARPPEPAVAPERSAVPARPDPRPARLAPAWPAAFAARISSGGARIGRLLRAGARSASGGMEGGARAASGWVVTSAPVAARALVVNLGMPEDVLDESESRPAASAPPKRRPRNAEPSVEARPARRAS